MLQEVLDSQLYFKSHGARSVVVTFICLTNTALASELERWRVGPRSFVAFNAWRNCLEESEKLLSRYGKALFESDTPTVGKALC